MPDQNERNNEKSEMRVMWIMTAVIVLIILGLMGWNMLTHPDWMHGALLRTSDGRNTEVSYRQEPGKQLRLGLIVALKVGRRDAFSGFRASRRVVGLRAKSAQPASAERCRGWQSPAWRQSG